MQNQQRNQATISKSWWMLKITFGLVPIVAGLDKFTNFLVDWGSYLNPMVTRLLPVSTSTFMMVVGVIEILAGALVLSRWTRLGAYVVSAWLVGIALNLITAGNHLDIAVRDLVMAVSAYQLAKLSEAREGARAAVTPRLQPLAA